MEATKESTLIRALPCEDKFITDPLWFSMKYAEKDMENQKVNIQYIRVYRDRVEVYFRYHKEDQSLHNLKVKTLYEKLFDCGGIFDEYNHLPTQSDDLSIDLYRLDIDFGEDKYDAKFYFYYKLKQHFPDIKQTLETEPILHPYLKLYGLEIIRNWVNGTKSKASCYGGKSEFADMLFLDDTIRWFILGIF